MEQIIGKICKRFLKIVLGIFYDIHVSGLENIPKTGQSIIVMNHQSFLDAPILYAYVKRDIKFLAYYKLFDVKFLGKLLKFHHDIPIKDKDKEAIKEAFGQCCNVLNNKHLLCMFPEGWLTPDGKIHEFKSGIKHLWSQCPSPIIPVAIDGAFETVFSRNSLIPHRLVLRNPFRRKKIYINIGKLYPHQVNQANLRSSVVALHQEINHVFKKHNKDLI